MIINSSLFLKSYSPPVSWDFIRSICCLFENHQPFDNPSMSPGLVMMASGFVFCLTVSSSGAELVKATSHVRACALGKRHHFKHYSKILTVLPTGIFCFIRFILKSLRFQISHRHTIFSAPLQQFLYVSIVKNVKIFAVPSRPLHKRRTLFTSPASAF